MELLVLRFSSGHDSTLGALFDATPRNSKPIFLCFTLEDEHRPIDQKVRGETRIPSGRYRLILRKEGGQHERYLKKYGAGFHKGMLWLRTEDPTAPDGTFGEVPNFKWILIHMGNTDDHTEGCLLVGDRPQQNVTKDGIISNSAETYERIYPPIAREIEEGKRVFITYLDFDAPRNVPENVDDAEPSG